MYIDQSLQRALTDRIYEKRKPAALQLEQIVRRAVEQGNMELVAGIIGELSRDYAYALRHPNYRNGGLIGLAGVAIALGPGDLGPYLEDIVEPILACFGDADSRVRYYACEALYNVAKIAKGEMLVFFNEIFDALCKLTGDLDDTVRNGANLVDQLMRDIVVETASTYVFQISTDPPEIPVSTVNPEGLEGPAVQDPAPQIPVTSGGGPIHASFTLEKFVPLMVERIYVTNPATRVFVVQWIMLLESIPDLELIKYLPGFLEGLVLYLTDGHKEVRVITKTCLDTLLRDITEVAGLKESEMSHKRETPAESLKALDLNNNNNNNNNQGTAQGTAQGDASDATGADAGLYQIGQDTYISYAEIVDILLNKLDPSHDEIRLLVLDWMEGILMVSASDVFAKVSILVGILLPALSDPAPEIRQSGQKLNGNLLQLIPDHVNDIDVGATAHALNRQLDAEDKVLRLSVMEWLRSLYVSDTDSKKATNASANASANASTKVSGSNPTSGTTTTATTSAYESLLVKLLGPLTDPNDEVVVTALQLLSLVLTDSDDTKFEGFVFNLLQAFRLNPDLFEHRGRSVILQLCILLTPERLFMSMGKIVASSTLGDEPKSAEETKFDTLVIQTMANILLAASELRKFRTKLTQLQIPTGADLFTSLFANWEKNPVAVLALCLLAGAYEPAFHVLQIIARYNITAHNLLQIDKLVKHIEGPTLAPLRMDLLDPTANHFLYKTLYGMMMVLPQSTAFGLLQKRLDSVSSISRLRTPEASDLVLKGDAFPSSPKSTELKKCGLDWPKLIRDFGLYQRRKYESES